MSIVEGVVECFDRVGDIDRVIVVILCGIDLRLFGLELLAVK